MEVNTPTEMYRWSSHHCIPNINHQEVLTLREAAAVRAQFTTSGKNMIFRTLVSMDH